MSSELNAVLSSASPGLQVGLMAGVDSFGYSYQYKNIFFWPFDSDQLASKHEDLFFDGGVGSVRHDAHQLRSVFHHASLPKSSR
jgi:hypothetical protein